MVFPPTTKTAPTELGKGAGYAAAAVGGAISGAMQQGAKAAYNYATSEMYRPSPKTYMAKRERVNR